MKEQLKKADVLGLAIIAAAVISYSSGRSGRSIRRSQWSLAACSFVVSLAVKADEIRTGLGRRSARFGINSAVSVLFFVGILAFVNYLGAQHVKRVDMTTREDLQPVRSVHECGAAGEAGSHIKPSIRAASTLRPRICWISSKRRTTRSLTNSSTPTSSRRSRNNTRSRNTATSKIR